MIIRGIHGSRAGGEGAYHIGRNYIIADYSRQGAIKFRALESLTMTPDNIIGELL
jgi:hypothetical protein